MVMDKVTLVTRATKKVLKAIFKENKITNVLFLKKIIKKSVDGIKDTTPPPPPPPH